MGIGLRNSIVGGALLLGMMVAPEAASAQEETAAVSQALFTVNNTWMLVATFLVFIMHLGFACLESGLTQAKNTVNILFKNTAIVAVGLITYAVVGFNLMYPGDFALGQFFGFAGFGLDPGPDGNTIAYADGAYTYWTDFIFQAMFAATAATIVSRAVAERIKLGSFLVFTTFYVALIYPIVGSWKWGGGWLDAMGFYDFAGSTLVHSVGGWGALAGIIVLARGRGDGLWGGTIVRRTGFVCSATLGCIKGSSGAAKTEISGKHFPAELWTGLSHGLSTRGVTFGGPPNPAAQIPLRRFSLSQISVPNA